MSGAPDGDDRGDYVAVTRLLAAYGSLLDRGRHDDWLALFAEPSEFVIDGRRPRTTTEGRRDLAERAPRGLHLGNPPMVEFHADGTATSVQTFLFWDPGEVGALAGWYDDDLVRVEGIWRFRRRAISFLRPGAGS